MSQPPTIPPVCAQISPKTPAFATFGPDSPPSIAPSVRVDGYNGIWYALGCVFEYGDKYSGGLGTYTANHQPMAVYAPAVNKTFFTYGGTTGTDRRELVIMVSYYDHTKDVVPRPVALHLDTKVDDPHDNAAIHIDEAGYVWVFKSGRGVVRPGIVFRTVRPYDLDTFELVSRSEFTYPQIWRGTDESRFFLLFTKYFEGTINGQERRLFWKTSPDGLRWSEDHPLAGFGGHYQTSGRWSSGGVTKFATFFNWHPESHVDHRTNLYYAQTTDGGKTWTTAGGEPLRPPFTTPDNASLVLDLKSLGRFMYTCDLNFDASGNPVLLCIISRFGQPGPKGDPREWTLLHWTGKEWEQRVVAVSDHNYDMGSLLIEGDVWRIIGPTEAGPQKLATGGEIATWVSRDAGRTWEKRSQITSGSEFNHSYARRPINAHTGFAAFWADGSPNEISESRIYFTDGRVARRLPYRMFNDEATPENV